MLIESPSTPPPYSARSARPGARVLLITEGTYPHVIGGVSSWCDLLIGGLPGSTGRSSRSSRPSDRDRRSFEVPAHAELLPSIDLWSSDPPPAQDAAGAGPNAELASTLVR